MSIKDQAPPEPTLKDCAMPCRQNGKLVLDDILYRLDRRMQNLQILRDMLPTQMTPEQDEALWQIACELERRE